MIVKKNHEVHGSTFFGFPPEYRLKVPPESATIFYCPPGHIVVVYAKHFDFGLRFPLHSFVEKIFRSWNVCLAQVTPPTIRNVISYVWLCLFKEWALTLNEGNMSFTRYFIGIISIYFAKITYKMS